MNKSIIPYGTKIIYHGSGGWENCKCYCGNYNREDDTYNIYNGWDLCHVPKSDIEVLDWEKPDKGNKRKAVLVIDMPESCDVCDFTDMANGKIYCGVPGCGKNTEDYIACRPEWCPLAPVPEHDTESYFPDEYMDGYKGGWNACIDAICGK